MMKSLRKYAIAVIACLCIVGTVQAAKEDILQKFLDNYRVPFDAEVELGVWHGDLDKCKELADKHGIPMIAVWSMEGCAHCEILEKALMSDAFNNWAKESGLILCFTCSKDPKGKMRYKNPSGDNTTIGTTDGAYYWFCKRPNLLSNYPYVRFYWYEDGKKKVDYSVHGDKIDGQQGISGGTYDKAGNNCINYIKTKSGLLPYLESPKTLSSYLGGVFSLEESEGHRLEAEAGTGEISVEMVRDAKSAETATNNIVKVIGPDGATVQEVNVEWAEGQTSQDVTVDMSKVTFSKAGDKALLVAASADGAEQGTNTVTYVEGAGESLTNPLWIGERKAVADRSAEKPVLQYGEWTMDLDVAKAKVAAEEGQAYTLVAVEGSLWCHDCANTERNFTGVKDRTGANRLSAWAQENKVALVAMDIPSFSTNSVSCESPTLLSRTSYTTTLAYELPSRGYYDVSKGGAPGSLTNATVRSGLGYLTRKGVSDAEALEVLTRNYNLVSTDVSEGGYHNSLDKNTYRTHVPIYVLLRKDGTVAARMTRFAFASPMAADREKWDDYIKRFDEMLAIAKDGSEHDDGGVLENDYPSADLKGFAANGGNADGEISHCDFQDVFKLEGVGGNALQKVVVTGACDAVVSVQFLKLNAEGKAEDVGTAATGKLSNGVTLEETFAESGDFFVKVSGGDIASGDFAADNATVGNFAAYSISGDVVLVPQEGRASGSAPADSDKVVMRLEEGQMYRIEGVRPDAVSAVLEAKNEDPYCKFYTALASGDVEVTAAYGNGGTVTYQKWIPGKVGFVAASKTVTESAGDVWVRLARTNGASGEVKVRVSLDEAATTLYNSEKEARFEFEEAEFTWDDSKDGETNIVVRVLDDKRFDGVGDVALKLELLKDENGDTVLTTSNYVLTVTEDDRQSAGTVAFTDVEPFFSKKLTVYAKESEGATVYAERIDASDGYVTAQVKTSSADVALEVDGTVTNALVWANHKYDKKAIKVTGLAAGKTATLTIEKPTDGLKVLTSSNKVTVVSIADDAPEFENDVAADTIYRYVAISNVYPVVLAGGAEDAKLTFSLLQGKLPAGLKATTAGTALAIVGTATANPGTYPVVYQVTQQLGTTKTAGLTLALTLTVEDPTDASGGTPCNDAVAAQKSRTIKDIPVIDRTSDRLVGLLQVTVPKTGKISAKYTCSAGSISFTAKGWSAYDEESQTLSAQLSSTKKGYAMELGAEDNGSITATLTDPSVGEGVDLVAVSTGNVWSKTNNASDWAGKYTVALIHESVAEAVGHEGVAPRGNGYLTLKMEKTAVNTGTVTWAGKLPNGTKVSGSAVLNIDGSCDDNVKLPVYKASSTDILALLIDVCGTTLENSDIKALWRHTDKKKYAETSYDVDLNVFGGFYAATNNLAEICTADYGTTALNLTFDLDGLQGATASGEPQPVDNVPVTIKENTISVAKGNAAGATLSFTRSTGIVSGKFQFQCETDAGLKTVKASYEGVVLQGWGPGCGCGDGGSETPLPFVVGGYYIDDKELVEVGGKNVSVSVKRGGAVSINK